MIGFHTIDYANHFLKCVEMVKGLEDDMHILKYENRLVKVDVFPIGVDYNKYYDAYNNDKVAQLRENLKNQFRGKKIIFSADRLDYTKGVYNRLKAFDRFLTLHPEYHEKVVFVLVIVPSRDTITKYAERKKMIDEYIGDINSRIGSIKWQPVIYQYINLEFENLIALYTGCDVALITPLRDGMNLVAKEFIASRSDRKGVLILSEMAGAAKELTEALLINPNDEEDVAEKIRLALAMTIEEQARKMRVMQQRLCDYDITAWADDFIHQLDIIKEKQKSYEVKFIDRESKAAIVNAYRMATRALLLLDYDGTLVPFADKPENAAPDVKLVEVLTKLAFHSKNNIYIISGRDSNSLERWFSNVPVNMVAEHGAMHKIEGQQWEHLVAYAQDWKQKVGELMESYARRCANSFVEEKDYSLAWHYRAANPEQAKLRSAELHADLTRFTKHKNLNIVHGNKVVEVRNRGFDKGTTVKQIMSSDNFDFIIAIGDDSTDEDMFRALTKVDHAFTLKVGPQASYANLNLHNTGMVLSLLELLGNTVSAPYRLLELEKGS